MMTAKILVIDDEVPLLEEIVEWLEFEGFEVRGANNGEAGIAIALEQLPDLILSDVNMPGIDGYRVLLELRTHAPLSLTPFIFLTAMADRRNVRYGMELGADDYITKPFSHSELLSAIRSRLEKIAVIQERSDSALNKLRHSLLYALPHELRTPLNSILGFGELLKMDADTIQPEKIALMADSIVAGGRRLYHLIENYLLYAQLEMQIDRSSLGMRTAEVAEYITLCSAQVAARYNRSPLLALTLVDAPLKLASVDLSKIVTELVDNAFKFSAATTPVEISSQVDAEGYHLQIRDSGRGIAPQYLDQIGPYMQFDRALYEQQGSGLGLVIAQRLAEQCGGRLTLESKVGMGTTVTVLLPLAPAK